MPVQAKASATQLRWDDTSNVLCNFYFTSGQYKATVIGLSGTTKVSATIVVYEVNGNQKTEVARISDTKTGVIGEITGSYGFVKGRTYTMEVTATVYRNGGSEATNHAKTLKYE